MISLRLLRSARPMQVGFLVLLSVCSAQLAYWMLDEVRYTAEMETRLRAGYEAEVESARALLRSGSQWADIAHAYPDVAISPDSATLSVDSRVLAQMHAERFHRLNRYAWEGAFFLAVLLASMAVVYRAVREEDDLRRRQEQFLAQVSHELKSPLASLRLSAETLSLRDPPAERRAELVQRLLADLGRLQRMIANLLDTSRLASPEMGSVAERVVLADEVSAVVAELRDLALEGATQVVADVPGELVVLADPEGVRTVLRNLLHNAIKATSGGGAVAVQANRHDGVVRLDVRDDGIGFPPNEAKKVFEKFYRVEGDPRTRPGGTGLGLYLVRRCVQLDGGTVTAESEGPGRGARFTVTWRTATELVP